MRLADFLEQHAESVLTEWVTFARTQPGADGMNLTALRDHAAEMLTAIVADLRTEQTAAQQNRKAHGTAVLVPDKPETAAEAHGGGRADSGFTVAEMLAEFRALRASVLRLWTKKNVVLTGADLDDLSRFHEAVDQALAESISRFAMSVTQSQELFMAVLGHDLRTPLNTVTMVAKYLADVNRLDSAQASMIERALRSVKRMTHMLDDLVDFTRSRVGMRLHLQLHDTDLQSVIEHAVDEFRSNSPRHEFVMSVTGDLRGRWDAPRIGQVLANLLGNAVQHGTAAAPVEIIARGDAREVVLEVRNTGPIIRAEDLPTLFSPFKRLRAGAAVPTEQNMGLGLYIAQQIVSAHGGQLVMSSTTERGTTFAAHLPRRGTSDMAVHA